MWLTKERKQNWRVGLVPASQVFGYILLVAGFMSSGEKLLGRITPPLGPMLFLTLFIVSALLCSLIVFGKPYRLFVDKKQHEAIDLVVATTKWLAVFLVGVIGLIAAR